MCPCFLVQTLTLNPNHCRVFGLHSSLCPFPKACLLGMLPWLCHTWIRASGSSLSYPWRKGDLHLGIFFSSFSLEDNCFTILCWPLPYIKMNKPQIYIYPLSTETPSHLPSHLTPLDCHKALDWAPCATQYISTCMGNLERWYRGICLQGSNGDADIENRFVDPVREERVRWIESIVETYTLPYVK